MGVLSQSIATMCQTPFKRNLVTFTSLLSLAIGIIPAHGEVDTKTKVPTAGTAAQKPFDKDHQMDQANFSHCQKVMMNSGIDVINFPFAAAHRIHSITLHELRFWFDAEAPLKNGIPTINHSDLTSDNLILENAIDHPSPFTSPFMKAFDTLLSQVTNPNYEVTGRKLGTDENQGPLPLLVYRFLHKAHMNDLWAMMKPTFEYLVKNPPNDRNLCPCVKDHINNGVMFELKKIAYAVNKGTGGKTESEVLDPKAIHDFWTEEQRDLFLDFYDEKLKVDTYGATMFVYCKLKE